MLVELIDRLRCINRHEDGWLVASATQTVDRDIITGALGCPVCGAEYEIRDGAAWFGASEALPDVDPARFAADATIRLAAMLGVDARGGVYVLDAGWSRFATSLSAMCAEARLVVLSAPWGEGAGAVLRCTGGAIPVAAGCARGVALDRVDPALVTAAVQVLAPGGRLVAPAGSDTPPAVRVLARDEHWWVGERERGASVSAPVTPRRAAPRTGNR
ncbi:MAG: hypothetical protein ACHQQ3_14155 [Gemmatimonadales bacterium]